MDDPTDWKQAFPTYSFKNKDIVLHEYDSAAAMLESEERVFLNASNLIIAAATLASALAIGSLETVVRLLAVSLPPLMVLSALVFALGVVSIVSLLYLADRQRSVVLAAQKVIVLRRMLGLSYGPIDLVLPSNKVQGADDPFEIRLFPGWSSTVAYPFWILAVFSILLMLYLLVELQSVLGGQAKVLGFHPWAIILCLTLLWALILARSYRSALFETHEDWTLASSLMLSRFLNLKLVANFESVIYQATLAKYEALRLNVDLSEARRMAVFIEDDRFFDHPGVSYRGLARAFLGIVGLKERTGGSTITMQLARSLFIVEHQKTIRRKILEVFLALWLEHQFDKGEILDLYLVSVRYDAGVYGILSASKHFFGSLKDHLAGPEAFVLIERVSVTQSALLPKKVAATLKRAISKEVLTPTEAAAAVSVYSDLIERKAIIGATHADLEVLEIAAAAA
jgi:penicillin-binding protein 1A